MRGMHIYALLNKDGHSSRIALYCILVRQVLEAAGQRSSRFKLKLLINHE